MKINAKNFIGVYVVIGLFIIALLVMAIYTKKLLHTDDEIAKIPVEVLITLASALLAGGFTILAVDRTLNKQTKNEFVQKFPMKIYYIDELIKNLKGLREDLNPNAPLLITKKENLSGLFQLSTEIDGYVYFRVRESYVIFSEIINDMYYGGKSCFEFNYGSQQWEIVEDKEELMLEQIRTLKEITKNLLNICEAYRDDFIQYYNKNVDKEIYKKIS